MPDPQRPYHTDSDNQRVREYFKWRAFTAGDQLPNATLDKEPQTTVTWTTRDRYPGMVVNYARTLLRKTISYALPEPVRFNVIAPKETDTSEVEQTLHDTIDALDMHAIDVDVALEAAEIGDSAIKITHAADGSPQVAHIDPGTITIETDPHLPDRITQLRQTYAMRLDQFPPDWPRPTVAEPDSAGYVSVTEHWTDTDWQVSVATDALFTTPNPYGWIPYVILGNERPPRSPWGHSDLVDLEPICRQLNHETTTLGRILEVSGYPITVLENVEGAEGINVRPGARWTLPEGSKAYLLDLLQGGGVKLHIDYLDSLYRMLHDVSETPRTSFGDSGRALSGVALEVEIQPLVQKVRRKRAALSRFYRDRNRMILDLLDIPAELRETNPIWAPILPSDESEAVRNNVLRYQVGLTSATSALARMGDSDPEGELQRIADERAAQAPAAPAPAAPDDDEKEETDALPAAG